MGRDGPVGPEGPIGEKGISGSPGFPGSKGDAVMIFHNYISYSSTSIF